MGITSRSGGTPYRRGGPRPFRRGSGTDQKVNTSPPDTSITQKTRVGPTPGQRGAPAYPQRKPLLSVATQLGQRTNATSNARSGQNYMVKADQQGNFYHVYGRGKKARRVKLSSDAVKSYGYR